MAGDITFFSLAGPMEDYTGAPTVIFRGICSILLARRNNEAAMGGAGVGGSRGGHYFC